MAADAPAPARDREMCPDEVVEGVVLRLPQPGVPRGTRLLLALGDGRQRELYATASKGAAVLACLLERHRVEVGDHVQIASLGWRRTRDGQRQYRNFQVRVLERARDVDREVT